MRRFRMGKGSPRALASELPIVVVLAHRAVAGVATKSIAMG